MGRAKPRAVRSLILCLREEERLTGRGQGVMAESVIEIKGVKRVKQQPSLYSRTIVCEGASSDVVQPSSNVMLKAVLNRRRWRKKQWRKRNQLLFLKSR